MVKSEKTSRGTLVWSSTAFILIGFMLLGFVYDNASKKAKEAQRIERELPLGTLERMKHEVSQTVANDKSVNFEIDGAFIKIILRSKDVPKQELIESDFQSEYASVLKAIDRSGFEEFKVLMITSESPLVNKFGNTKVDLTAFATFEKSNLDIVNWVNFKSSNLEAIATGYDFNSIVKRVQPEQKTP